MGALANITPAPGVVPIALPTGKLDTGWMNLSTGAIGAAPNSAGMSVSGGVFNLEPANASFGGVITTGAQTIAGSKTFSTEVVIGSDPLGSEILRVGGNITVGSGQLRLLSQYAGTKNIYSGAAINNRVWVTQTGASNLDWSVATMDDGEVGAVQYGIRITRSGTTISKIELGPSGTPSSGVTIGADPGGGDLLRGTGGFRFTADSILTSTTDATSTTSAALIISGGIGWGATKTSYGGGLLLVSPTIGLGYATGAGGTVTQATSKSTGVTLNKVCGTITMNAASLPAASSVSFTLSNSTISATDLIVVNIKSGATVGAYDTHVESVSDDSCVISLRNHTLGALAEAVVLSFALLKAPAA